MKTATRKTQVGEIDTHIAGIPCQIKIDSYVYQKPLGPRADSDYDCYGYSECEYTVLDRKGYPAAWLERKMTDLDRERIENEIEEYKEEDREEARAYSRQLSREEY